MLLIILQAILLALWYTVPVLQLIPWWVAWMPALMGVTIWIVVLLFTLASIIAACVSPSK